MIEYIKGILTELTPTLVVIDCNGIGYGLQISINTYTALNHKKEVKLFVYEVIREDAHTLYGFITKKERELFLLLISVSGVGPNTARVILSSISPSDLIQTITIGDELALKSVKGIGLKTAQRIIVDLKNKIKIPTYIENLSLSPVEQGSINKINEEALSALIMLGFSKVQSQKALKKIHKEAPLASVEEVIKQALRIL